MAPRAQQHDSGSPEPLSRVGRILEGTAQVTKRDEAFDVPDDNAQRERVECESLLSVSLLTALRTDARRMGKWIWQTGARCVASRVFRSGTVVLIYRFSGLEERTRSHSFWRAQTLKTAACDETLL